MTDKINIEDLSKEIDILTSKINILAMMFKDYVDSNETIKLNSGKWYPEPIDISL